MDIQQNIKEPVSFDQHSPREIPIEGEFVSLAGEIAALLNRHAKEQREIKEKYSQELLEMKRFCGRVMQIVFHLENALNESEKNLVEKGEVKTFKRFRIIKDQVKDHLTKQGYLWRDPTGEQFTNELAEMVEVDGWRHSKDYDCEVVVEIREPIILFGNELILGGAVIIGAPEE